MSDAPKIKIKGGDYKAIDTGDGYFTIKDVPLASTCPKGTKGAPYDVTEKVLEEFVSTAQSRYNQGHFCGTAYIGHNPDIPITHPDFAGYVLPNRVGKCMTQRGEVMTAFGDIKMSAAKFEKAKRGELPYVSPEIPWKERRIAGLAFLDTLPPYNEYALFTIGEVTSDVTAKFEAEPYKDDKDEDKKKKKDTDKEVDEDAEFAKHYPKKAAMFAKFEAMMTKLGQPTSSLTADPITKKPDALPTEPKVESGGAKMTADAEFAAQFAAQTNTIAELQAWRVDQENSKKTAELVVKAETALAHKIMMPALRDQLATFAADAVKRADGIAWFDKMLEALKPSLRDKPTAPLGSLTAANGVAPSDPVVAKFAQQGPEAMEEAGKFAAQWRELKRMFGDRITTTEEQHITNEIGLARARRDGLFSENGNGR